MKLSVQLDNFKLVFYGFFQEGDILYQLLAIRTFLINSVVVFNIKIKNAYVFGSLRSLI